nr:MAG TPA: hypothetical protein [Caudoviricetes sp.]
MTQSNKCLWGVQFGTLSLWVSLYGNNNHTTTITFHISHGCKIPYRGWLSSCVIYSYMLRA